MLMCRAHWAQVEPATQREVYATVGKRGRCVDASWAPWWRAAHTAIAEVARAEGRDPERLARWLAKEMRFADELE
jgi:hypothetical protein